MRRFVLDMSETMCTKRSVWKISIFLCKSDKWLKQWCRIYKNKPNFHRCALLFGWRVRMMSEAGCDTTTGHILVFVCSAVCSNSQFGRKPTIIPFLKLILAWGWGNSFVHLPQSQVNTKIHLLPEQVRSKSTPMNHCFLNLVPVVQTHQEWKRWRRCFLHQL